MYNILDQHKIFSEWKNFISNRKNNKKNIRDFILKSWSRCLNYQLDPYNLKNRYITERELSIRIKKNIHFLEVIDLYMKKIDQFIYNDPSVFIVSDQDGIVLKVFKKDDSEEVSAIIPGRDMSEKTIGTNGIGTSIIEDRAIQIWSCEHFHKEQHIWCCSAETIHNEKGEIIGSINLMIPWNKINIHTLGMIATTAGAIERQMIIEKTLKQKTFVMNQQNTILELIDEGIIVIDKDENITSINNQARTMLSLGVDSVIGKSIYGVIKSGVKFSHIISDGKDIQNREASIELKRGFFRCIMSTAIVFNEDFTVNGVVITIKEHKKVRKFVNKVIGSKALLTFHDIIGGSENFQKVVKISKKAGRSRSNVLLLGESGTGKELFAQAIHNYSDRKNGPFIAVNCGALPRNLVESELFGYEGGAFTGSKKEGHPGKFELADEGTIFLDEIGDMPLEAQVNLLRVLESGEVIRVGGKYPKKVNVRVIAATNKDLYSEVLNKNFRDDLYYRLNVFKIDIPPLRERVEDIPILANYFIRKFSDSLWKNITGISKDGCKALASYSWPGNIRELENVIERAVNITEKREITIDNFPDDIKNGYLEMETLQKVVLKKESLISKEYQAILSTLEEFNGNIRKSAQTLGIARSTLYEKIKKFNIDMGKFRK